MGSKLQDTATEYLADVKEGNVYLINKVIREKDCYLHQRKQQDIRSPECQTNSDKGSCSLPAFMIEARISDHVHPAAKQIQTTSSIQSGPARYQSIRRSHNQFTQTHPNGREASWRRTASTMSCGQLFVPKCEHLPRKPCSGVVSVPLARGTPASPSLCR